MISFFSSLLFVYAFSTSEIVYSNVRFIVSTCASFTFTSFTTASATVIFDSVLSLNRPLHLQLALFTTAFADSILICNFSFGVFGCSTTLDCTNVTLAVLIRYTFERFALPYSYIFKCLLCIIIAFL